MRKAIGLMAMAAALASVGWASAEEPKSAPKKESVEGSKAAPEKPDKEKKETVEDRQRRREEAFEAAKAEQDFDKALTVLDDMVNDKEATDDYRLRVNILQFRILAEQKHDGAKACSLAKKIAEAKKAKPKLLEETPLPHALNALAWIILDTPDLKHRDLDLALTMAKQAAEESKHEEAAILDTLARAYFEKKDLDKAVEFQTKAVAKCVTDDKMPEAAKTQIATMKRELKATLEKYKAKKEGKKP